MALLLMASLRLNLVPTFTSMIRLFGSRVIGSIVYDISRQNGNVSVIKGTLSGDIVQVVGAHQTAKAV